MPAYESGGSGLRRTLSLRDLLLYGIVVIQPVAPMSIYGVLAVRSGGHAVVAILLAMVATLLTAISYGRMATKYPSAGSAFTYVSLELNPTLGFLAGWSMTLDYALNPTICIVWIAQELTAFVPGVPYSLWAVVLAVIFTAVNARGIETSARLNLVLTIFMCGVIAVFLAAAAHYIGGVKHGPGFFTEPLYGGAHWNSHSILNATSIAVLTYMGFDGISTLSDEAKSPKRDILTATVLACLCIGALSAVQVYACQLVWPSTGTFPSIDGAFTYIAGRTWQPLYFIVGMTLIVANFGSGLGAQLAAARLLYGMGRTGALPRTFFSKIDAKRHVPLNNVLLMGALALAGALLLPAFSGNATGYELGASLLNFGALISFMGVNAAAFVCYFMRARKRTIANAAAPIPGFLVCLLLWLNLSPRARLIGAVWLACGIVYAITRRSGRDDSAIGAR